MALVRLKGFKRTSKVFESLVDARRWAEALETELKAVRTRTGIHADYSVSAVTIRQLSERFLADPVVSQLKWHDELTDLLATWADEFGGIKVRDFGRIHVETMRDKLLARKARPLKVPPKAPKVRPVAAADAAPKPAPVKPKTLSPARVNRYMAAMRRAWKWGTVKGYVLPSQPWPAEIMLTEPKAKPIIATEPEVKDLFAACDAVATELGMLVRFLVGTGTRLTDALAVTWRDVDQNAGDVAVRGQKTSNPLRVAMLSPAKDAIASASKVKHLSGRVFWQYKDSQGPQWNWQKARKQFPEHMREWRLHDCRHLCAGLLVANGATDVEIAAQLGHATLQMVQRYAHLRGGHRGAAHDKLDKAFGG